MCSSAVLFDLPGFKIVKGLSTKDCDANSVKRVDGVNVDNRPAKMYRAIAAARKMMEAQEDQYDKLTYF
jgi:hypothetical protein